MIFLRACLILGLVAMSFGQLDVDQLFQVDTNTNLEGGCGYVGRDRLNLILQDAVRLANAFITAANDATNPQGVHYKDALRIFYSYFKIRGNANQIGLVQGMRI